MFFLHPPEIRPLEQFTTLPPRYRQPRRSAWADANQGGRESDSFLEGPVAANNGDLDVSAIPFGRVFRIDPKGEWDPVAQWDVKPNGTKCLNATELLVTDSTSGSILRATMDVAGMALSLAA